MKSQNSIELSSEEYKSIESIIRGCSKKYGISGVGRVNIQLNKEDGLVIFKKGESDPIELLKQGLSECAKGALLLKEYLSTTEDPEIQQLSDTIEYVMESRKDSFI